MGNAITRLTHHKSRHTHREIDVSVPPPDQVDGERVLPPRKPSLNPVTEDIISATEKGMISENLLCSSLPSPAVRRAGGQARSYFPDTGRGGSVESDGSHSEASTMGRTRSVRWKGQDT
ncbi:hypothetical protein SNOG_08316 [Parastagonospora nodorum SN15]|uniref:Uncharacterized protein n=1 Tax=Phaeosphaeria nodorum (strain SN15 / ATCC MYA-4574 / FGSC 10173) TaxID=321614 RepID=Q0UIU8_PHANO|nr:hypothetical protein SNOG_08316 [Parastagonospora nodorum SN15]EAT84592.1 hypothetical protein SNOG_08316 [Parastagonospora nodorum SN15]